jgi:hypothetical protein
MEMMNLSALTFVYGGVLILGLLIMASSLVALARSFTAGSQAPSQPGAGRSLLRAAGFSLGLAAFVFGAVGLLAELVWQFSPASGILWSLAAGLIAGFFTQIILVWRSGRQAAEEQAIEYDVAGKEAEVLITVPAGGLGEILYRDTEGPIHLGASSSSGQSIETGARVIIERVSNRVAIVRPASDAGGN